MRELQSWITHPHFNLTTTWSSPAVTKKTLPRFLLQLSCPHFLIVATVVEKQFNLPPNVGLIVNKV